MEELIPSSLRSLFFFSAGVAALAPPRCISDTVGLKGKTIEFRDYRQTNIVGRVSETRAIKVVEGQEDQEQLQTLVKRLGLTVARGGQPGRDNVIETTEDSLFYLEDTYPLSAHSCF